jgi:hypothetical protein
MTGPYTHKKPVKKDAGRAEALLLALWLRETGQ